MKRCSFTLVEMLVVLVIMGILLALVMPAFEKLTVGSGVDAAARMVGAQLRLTRQYAITSRTRVALLIPQIDEIDTIVNGVTVKGAARRYIQFRPCQVNAGNAWVGWIPNTKWDALPTGALIAKVDSSSTSPHLPPKNPLTPDVSNVVNITGVPGFGAGVVCAVPFKANGKLDESDGRYVWLAEGFPSAPGTLNPAATLRNTTNFIAIYIDQYTGRISYPALNPTSSPPMQPLD